LRGFALTAPLRWSGLTRKFSGEIGMEEAKKQFQAGKLNFPKGLLSRP